MENTPEVMDNSAFSVNEWFNDLPVRIIGSPEQPFFYANDIGAVLEIQNVRASVKNFDEVDIVMPYLREENGLVTYKIHRGIKARDDKITLLTELGVYKLIVLSRTKRAKEFRKFLFNKIVEIRRQEAVKLKMLRDKVKLLDEKCNTLMKYNAEVDDITPSGFIYFICNHEFDNKVKIGMSINPTRRIKELQTGNPSKLVIYHTIESPDYKKLEKTLHDIVGEDRLEGEWFELNRSQLEGIIGEMSNKLE